MNFKSKNTILPLALLLLVSFLTLGTEGAYTCSYTLNTFVRKINIIEVDEDRVLLHIGDSDVKECILTENDEKVLIFAQLAKHGYALDPSSGAERIYVKRKDFPIRMPLSDKLEFIRFGMFDCFWLESVPTIYSQDGIVLMKRYYRINNTQREYVVSIDDYQSSEFFQLIQDQGYNGIDGDAVFKLYCKPPLGQGE